MLHHKSMLQISCKKFQFRLQYHMLDFSRGAGVLLHISSLHSKYGIGTFGKEAFEFVDFLQACGFRYWQVLPLGPTGYGDSPYQVFSSFAGNTYFIDLSFLLKENLLCKKELDAFDFGSDTKTCDYGKLYEAREKVLRLAFEHFKTRNEIALCEKFLIEKFGTLYKQLEAYFLFCVLKAKHKRSWFDEAENIKMRKSEAINDLQKAFEDDINFYKFTQYLFFKQYFSLKEYANRAGIKIIGDLPFYSPYDSCDCWANHENFSFDENLSLRFVGGCPPDAFSDDGQYWGMPTYNWAAMCKNDYEYLMQRFEFNFKLFDVVRLDHFRGFESFWEINANEKTARNGNWVKSDGKNLFTVLKKRFSSAPFIAEDLGVITDEVRTLQNFCGFPGMKVLQFAFDDGGQSTYLPQNYADTFSVVYTGTHDNSTILGWLKTGNKEATNFAQNYLLTKSEKAFVQNFIRLAFSAVSFLTVVPIQDFLCLDETARMNTPATMGNWTWRMTRKDFYSLKKDIEKIKELLKMYNRI